MMTKATLQHMLDTYGDKIFTIQFNNGKHMYVGYQSSAKVADLEIKTEGGHDYLVVHRSEKPMNIPGRTDPIEFDMYYVIDFIEAIGIMNDGSETFRPDPYTLK